jgi:endonuclease/exonuclease/phosphatase family metal-dependent hydrolase
MLVCRIKIPVTEENPKERTLFASCLHLNLFHTGRKKQYQQISNYIDGINHDNQDVPFIVAGDFNDWNQKSFETFEHILGMQEVHKYANGNFARTFPANVPILCLDRIYVKNLQVMSSSVVFYDQHLSDHLPIFCEVDIK